jgi:hypothetical protein
MKVLSSSTVSRRCVVSSVDSGGAQCDVVHGGLRGVVVAGQPAVQGPDERPPTRDVVHDVPPPAVDRGQPVARLEVDDLPHPRKRHAGLPQQPDEAGAGHPGRGVPAVAGAVVDARGR